MAGRRTTGQRTTRECGERRGGGRNRERERESSGNERNKERGRGARRFTGAEDPIIGNARSEEEMLIVSLENSRITNGKIHWKLSFRELFANYPPPVLPLVTLSLSLSRSSQLRFSFSLARLFARSIPFSRPPPPCPFQGARRRARSCRSSLVSSLLPSSVFPSRCCRSVG